MLDWRTEIVVLYKVVSTIQQQTGRRLEAPKLFSNRIIFYGEVSVSSK